MTKEEFDQKLESIDEELKNLRALRTRIFGEGMQLFKFKARFSGNVTKEDSLLNLLATILDQANAKLNNIAEAGKTALDNLGT